MLDTEPRMTDRAELATTLVERAAAHQMRALATLREAQAPTRALSFPQRRQLLASVMEHLVRASDLLRNAQDLAAGNADVLAMLDTHRARLTAVAENAERLLESFTLRAPQD
jgi:hypothetical protein